MSLPRELLQDDIGYAPGKRRHGLKPSHMIVLIMICQGKSYKEIGSRLNYSPHTIKEWVYDMRRRIGAKNTVNLAAMAVGLGYVRIIQHNFLRK